MTKHVTFKTDTDMVSGVHGVGTYASYVMVDGERVGVVRKRAEWYGNLGHRGVRYTYYDFFRLGDEGKAVPEVETYTMRDGSTREERKPFVTNSARKRTVAEALAKLGYVEAARESDRDTADHYLRQRGEG